jgi:hypothetical protein
MFRYRQRQWVCERFVNVTQAAAEGANPTERQAAALSWSPGIVFYTSRSWTL